MQCKYTEFMAFSKTSKFIYRIARTIWKTWINKKFTNIITFVKPENNYKLLKILSQIKNGTLKDEVSVFIIDGPPCSGKTVFQNIIKKLFRNYKTIYCTEKINDMHLGAFINSIVFINYDNNIEKIANELHKLTNLGIIYREIFKSRKAINKPGTAIITTDKKIEIKIRGEKALSETELEKVIWNGFEYIPVEHLDNNQFKKPRYPIYLEFPHTFPISDSKIIISNCLKELNNYL